MTGSVDVVDDFDGSALDPAVWVPAYLPHWSSRAAARPRYRLDDGCLHLLIEPDQQPWCPEFDGSVRVSGIQTGTFAGPRGSRIGQHAFSPRCRVREPQPTERLVTPTYGRVEMRARCDIGPRNVAALWLIGFEDAPERSAELCVMEVKGWLVEPSSAVVGCGLRPFRDPLIADSFVEPRLPIDIRAFHDYSAEWRPDGVDVLIDGRVIHRVAQSPDYPMQLMLTLYDVEAGAPPEAEVVIDRVAVIPLG